MATSAHVWPATLAKDAVSTLMIALLHHVFMGTVLYVVNALPANMPCSSSCVLLQDLINDYSCSCEYGWSGKNCNVNPDDCNPNLCLHGGNCTVSYLSPVLQQPHFHCVSVLRMGLVATHVRVLWATQAPTVRSILMTVLLAHV